MGVKLSRGSRTDAFSPDGTGPSIEVELDPVPFEATSRRPHYLRRGA